MRRKTTWREKLAAHKGLPKVEPIPESMAKRWGTGTVVIPAPKEVDEIMKQVPEGQLVTINKIRQTLAKKHDATIGCPLATGIFAWIAAHASAEEQTEGQEHATPYWRTLKSGGEQNPKYPGGIEGQRARLESEGHRVIRKGKKYIVDGYEHRLAEL